MARPTRYPIVLCHGIAPFDVALDALVRRFEPLFHDAEPVFDRIHYFKGIAGRLRREGYRVCKTRVSFAAGTALRSRELKSQILEILARTAADRVHIIGHSMGGLDARRMIAREGMADKISTLTTIGTPHLGTPYAEWGIERWWPCLRKTLGKVIRLEGFQDLTPDACRKFNQALIASEIENRVVYRTVSSQCDLYWVFAPLRRAWRIIYEQQGANDGLVPVSSQEWRSGLENTIGTGKSIHRIRFPFPADHLNQIGWWRCNGISLFRPTRISPARYERAVRDFYVELVAGLAEFEP